jgi:hypothetical protein
MYKHNKLRRLAPGPDPAISRFLFGWRNFIPRPDDGGSGDLRNFGKVIQVYTALEITRQTFTHIYVFCCD